MNVRHKYHRAKRLTKRKQSASVEKGGRARDYRRAAQLVVSIILFFAVFWGRTNYSEEIGDWNDTIGTDVDFWSVLQSFGDDLSGDNGFVDAFKRLGVSLLGKETVATPTHEPKNEPRVEVVPLVKTTHFGLDQAADYGVLKGNVKVSERIAEAAATAVPAPTPTPAVVTAMAQSYGSDGRKLPSNVSFHQYELGLEQTTIPVDGEVTSGFGYRIHPISKENEFHLALDIAAAEGTKIAAFADGVVRYIGESEEFGLYFMIDHANHVSTFYAHCSELFIRKGETVVCGQVVALVGKTGNVTGPHLHLTILKDGIRLDPAYYVDL